MPKDIEIEGFCCPGNNASFILNLTEDVDIYAYRDRGLSPDRRTVHLVISCPSHTSNDNFVNKSYIFVCIYLIYFNLIILCKISLGPTLKTLSPLS